MPCGATHKKISPITYGDNHSGGAWNAVVLAKERVKQESPKRSTMMPRLRAIWNAGQIEKTSEQNTYPLGPCLLL